MARKAKFTVTLSKPYDKVVSVDYATVADTASEGEDFTPQTGTVTFQPGETSKDILIPVRTTNEDHVEHFSVQLSNPVEVVIDDGVGDALLPASQLLLSVADAVIVPKVYPPGTVYLDNFNGVAGPVKGRLPEVGGAWADLGNIGDTPFVTTGAGGAWDPTTPSSGGLVTPFLGPLPTGYVELDMMVLDASGSAQLTLEIGDEFGAPLFGFTYTTQDAGEGSYLHMFTDSVAVSWVSGVGPLPAGQLMRWRIEIPGAGADWRLLLDGVEVGTLSDPGSLANAHVQLLVAYSDDKAPFYISRLAVSNLIDAAQAAPVEAAPSWSAPVVPLGHDYRHPELLTGNIADEQRLMGDTRLYWFQLHLDDTGFITFDTETSYNSGFGYDTFIAIYRADDLSPVTGGFNDDHTGLLSKVAVDSLPAGDYLVAMGWYGYGNQDNAATLISDSELTGMMGFNVQFGVAAPSANPQFTFTAGLLDTGVTYGQDPATLYAGFNNNPAVGPTFGSVDNTGLPAGLSIREMYAYKSGYSGGWWTELVLMIAGTDGIPPHNVQALRFTSDDGQVRTVNVTTTSDNTDNTAIEMTLDISTQTPWISSGNTYTVELIPVDGQVIQDGTPPPPPPAPTYIEDTFTGSGAIESHVMDNGGTWQVYDFGDVPSAMEVNAGRLRFTPASLPPATGMTLERQITSPVIQDHTVLEAQAQFVIPSGTFSGYLNVVLRGMAPDGVTARFFMFQLYRWGGSWTVNSNVQNNTPNSQEQLFNYSSADGSGFPGGVTPFARDVVHTVRLVMRANNFQVFLDGVQIATSAAYNWVVTQPQVSVLLRSLESAAVGLEIDYVKLSDPTTPPAA